MRLSKIIVALLAACAASIAVAGICTPKEYAQYKDGVRTKKDQMGTAYLYCMNHKFAEVERTFPASTREKREEHQKNAEGCDTETAKILDALDSVHAKAAIKYITDGCESQK